MITGLSREWYSLVIKALFDPELGLFTTSTGGSESLGGYHINPLSGTILANHLNYFQFAGRMIGKSILEQQSIPASLSLPIRKQILGLPVSLSDLEFVDVELYKSLLWLKTCSVNEVEYLDLDFTVSYEGGKHTMNIESGQQASRMIQLDLIPDGATKTVTAENRNEYLMLMLKHRIFDSVAPQLTAFLHGINEVIPLIMLQVFDYQELDLLICGVPNISVDDWKEYTEYLGVYRQHGSKHKVIKWFWECVSEFDNEERARLLQFVTGCSRLPALGFRALQASDGYYRVFNIQSIDKSGMCV
jgi:E3 ubiquitin ligase SMURF1/2/E3 ubiquitin-protein ligase HUWE1